MTSNFVFKCSVWLPKCTKPEDFLKPRWNAYFINLTACKIRFIPNLCLYPNLFSVTLFSIGSHRLFQKEYNKQVYDIFHDNWTDSNRSYYYRMCITWLINERRLSIPRFNAREKNCYLRVYQFTFSLCLPYIPTFKKGHIFVEQL